MWLFCQACVYNDLKQHCKLHTFRHYPINCISRGYRYLSNVTSGKVVPRNQLNYLLHFKMMNMSMQLLAIVLATHTNGRYKKVSKAATISQDACGQIQLPLCCMSGPFCLEWCNMYMIVDSFIFSEQFQTTGKIILLLKICSKPWNCTQVRTLAQCSELVPYWKDTIKSARLCLVLLTTCKCKIADLSF